jgi:transcription-repair coupling factor (superfamily II helicase)
MTADAAKRLEAIQAAGDLGAGYQLATHDLEIRGAGELLGDEQSGQIQSVGFGLYSQLLRNAVEALRRGDIPDVDAPLTPSTEVNLHAPALIPDDYLPDPNMRLILYKRIGACESDAELREMQVEMIDRFGLLPDAVKGLFTIHSLRLAAARLGIRALELGARGGHIDFLENTAVDPLALVTLVQEQPTTYRLAGPTRLRVDTDLEAPRDRERVARELLERLTGAVRDEAA